MNTQAALTELESLAEKLRVEVVYDHFTGEGMSAGGLCKIKGCWKVIVERRGSVSDKLSVLARSLSRFEFDQHYLSPAVRQLLERHR